MRALMMAISNTKREANMGRLESVEALVKAGISLNDATALRRISMTLNHWFALECGDGNSHGSWAIVRGHKAKDSFEHDDGGTPYMEHHHYFHGRGTDYTSHYRIADREQGARKRLAKIMARYPGFQAYIQGDPRGTALYVLTPYHLERYSGQPIDSIYNHGIPVYR
jgi:hypothetical protein